MGSKLAETQRNKTRIEQTVRAAILAQVSADLPDAPRRHPTRRLTSTPYAMSRTPPGPPPDWPADSDATRNRPTDLTPEVLAALGSELLHVHVALSDLYAAATRLGQSMSACYGMGQRLARLVAEKEQLSADVLLLAARVDKAEKQIMLNELMTRVGGLSPRQKPGGAPAVVR